MEASLRELDVLSGIAPDRAVEGKYSQLLSQFLARYPGPEDCRGYFACQ